MEKVEMMIDSGTATLVEELRERAGAFVNSHVDLWVTVEDDGTLILAGQDPAALFQAAADWLEQGPACTVVDTRWGCGTTEPAFTLCLFLRPPGAELTPQRTAERV
ncbi:hypothetical protein G3I60_43365 [Streptomyces sp. SID13666]|uniref:hypothetical protein n=1 Tax=unclassified Streptomyces TaxID=2593676 RepID=UPI0013C23E3C|nr:MULTISPECIES: hypothetical protein [unclassified Streptomyces]NEA60821.1 hypothetical protein [Streptomyces sp. SID13666]NEA77285.1 hypothetical protein [Streptomyces sp. SID13588]